MGGFLCSLGFFNWPRKICNSPVGKIRFFRTHPVCLWHALVSIKQALRARGRARAVGSISSALGISEATTLTSVSSSKKYRWSLQRRSTVFRMASMCWTWNSERHCQTQNCPIFCQNCWVFESIYSSSRSCWAFQASWGSDMAPVAGSVSIKLAFFRFNVMAASYSNIGTWIMWPLSSSGVCENISISSKHTSANTPWLLTLRRSLLIETSARQFFKTCAWIENVCNEMQALSVAIFLGNVYSPVSAIGFCSLEQCYLAKKVSTFVHA